MQDINLDPLPHFHCPKCNAKVDTEGLVTFEAYACKQCGSLGIVPGKFGDFYLLEQVSESVTSVLFDAYDPKLERRGSIKILNKTLSQNRALKKAFKREALAAASLHSQHVLRVYDFGVQNRQSYMVLERMDGKFLSEILEKGPLPPNEVILLMHGIVEGLHEMHTAGIVHGDVMPRNILVHSDGLPRMTDFGLSRYEGEKGEHMDEWSSPYYMPPERILGEKEDFRGDFYSLGTTLYIMATGILPYFDMDEEVVKQRKISDPVKDPRSIQPGMNDALAELIGVLLHRDPEDRPSSYDELRELVEDVAEFLPKPEPKPVPEPPPLTLAGASTPKKKKKHPKFWFLYISLSTLFFLTIISWRAAVQREGEYIESLPPATPFPTSTPTPEPTPTPFQTPTPVPPTPTPRPTPTPTPTPRPFDPADVAGLTLRLEIQARIPERRVANWVNKERMGFSQRNPERQPLLQTRPNRPPMLRFDGDQMASSLTPHWNDAYTFILVVELAPTDKRGKEQLLIGVHPEAPGPSTVGIYREPAIDGSFRFVTDTGMARITVPREQRNLPAIIAFRKDGMVQEGYAAFRKGVLRPTGSERPPSSDARIGALQLGGFDLPGQDFQGWIGTVLVYNRALTEDELLKVFTYLRKQYPVNL